VATCIQLRSLAGWLTAHAPLTFSPYYIFLLVLRYVTLLCCHRNGMALRCLITLWEIV